MGAFAPYIISQDLKENIINKVVEPTIEELKSNNLFYRGVLYIGLMIVNEKILYWNINVRFGDPEAQVLIPLLEGDGPKHFYPWQMVIFLL